MLAIALDACEIDAVYADKSVAEAVELQDQAKAIEEGDSRRPESSSREETSEERQTPVIDSPAQQPAQQQQQIQPKNNDNPKKG